MEKTVVAKVISEIRLQCIFGFKVFWKLGPESA